MIQHKHEKLWLTRTKCTLMWLEKPGFLTPQLKL